MKRFALFFAFLVFVGLPMLQAQTVQITGKVTSSEDGNGVPGVSVVVKGTTIGTTTDFDGKYSLNVPSTATTLVYSFVGLKTQEVAISGRKNIDVVLESDVVGLEEVVVTAFGIKRSAREMGSATAKVSDKEITQAGVSNVVNGLNAKVSGLQINTINNGVNPDTKITLRGNRHFLASNQALVVLDGVPVSATFLNSVNPNDIESVNVLKGASASALYGNDASNGVLVITTRKGGKNKPVLKISNTTTFEQISYMPKLQERFGSGSGETPENSDPNYTYWIGPDRNTDPYTAYENQCYGPEFNGQMVILGGKLEDGSYQMVPYSAIKNQKKNFFDIGMGIQNDVSYSGGNENTDFYLSAQDLRRTGTIPGDKNNRTSLRMAGSKTYGKFGADFSLGLTQSNTNVSGGDMYQGRGVYWNVLNTPAHVPLTKYQNIDSDPFAALDGYFNAYYPNPYWQIAHSRELTKRKDVLGSVTLKFKPFEWLELSNRSGAVYKNENFNSYRDGADYSDYSKGDPWSQGHMGVSSPYSGVSAYSMYTTLNLTNDFLATFDKSFGDFTSKLILGTSLFATREDYMYSGASALVVPQLYNISNRVGEVVAAQSTAERRQIGAFADVTLGYKNYAFLHMSGRNDWDSRLVASNRSFFYPAVDVSFVVSDMIPSMANNSVLSYLKVRGGWSQTGLVSLSNWYATIPSYVAGAGFPYGSTAGYRISTALSNPNIKPEITNEFEGGLDASFLNNKLHLEATFYKSNTTDQTIPAQISAASGFYSAYVNSGELENKGLELDLKLTPLLALGDFAWNFSVNYAYQTNKVISIYPGLNELPVSDGDNTSASYAIVGEQFPAIKVSDVQRDPSGHIIVSATTGLPKKKSELVMWGHGLPNHILGIVNTFTYKGFTLNAVADYRGGNVIVNAVGNALDFTGVSDHSTLNGRQPFVVPNSVIDNGDGTYSPNTDVVVTNASRSFWVSSDYHNVNSTYTTSAAFWKLREVVLTYNVPVKKLWGGKYIQNAELGVFGRNLLMFVPKTNCWTDPEFNNSYTTSNAVGYTTEDQTPPTRIFGFTVKLTF